MQIYVPVGYQTRIHLSLIHKMIQTVFFFSHGVWWWGGGVGGGWWQLPKKIKKGLYYAPLPLSLITQPPLAPPTLPQPKLHKGKVFQQIYFWNPSVKGNLLLFGISLQNCGHTHIRPFCCKNNHFSLLNITRPFCCKTDHFSLLNKIRQLIHFFFVLSTSIICCWCFFLLQPISLALVFRVVAFQSKSTTT